MIASITGEISQIFDGQVVINVGGVGLLVNITEAACLDSRPGMRDLFVHLIGVAGIGPKTALTALSTLSPEAIRRAITRDQPEIFTRVPGIGRKTSQKIILDLQGKIQPFEPLEAATMMDDVDTEVMEALTALGYSIIEAQAALQSLGKDKDSDAETRLRKALQYFS